MKYQISSFSVLMGLSALALVLGCNERKLDETVSTSAAALSAADHEFSCNTHSVRSEIVHHQLTTLTGDSLRLGPTQEPCSYSLVYQSADGSRQVLNANPAMIFLAEAVGQRDANAGASVTVCWTQLDHVASDEPHPVAGYANRTILGGSLQCRTRTTAGWAAPIVVAESTSYAAWLASMAADPSQPGGVAITWRRDSTFNFLGATGQGRPDTDGAYASRIANNAVVSTLQTEKLVLSMDGSLLPAKSGDASILGFEDPAKWTTTAASRASSTLTEGSASLAVDARGWTTIVSAALSTPSSLGRYLAFDLQLPSTQVNPWWFGSAQLRASIPSRGLYDAYLGQVELTGQTVGQFNTQRFTIPEQARVALAGTYDDLSLTIVLNVPVDASGSYLLDNLRFLE